MSKKNFEYCQGDNVGVNNDPLLINTDNVNNIPNQKLTFEKINSNKFQISTLENLRDTLLPKLMSGEIRVQH